MRIQATSPWHNLLDKTFIMISPTTSVLLPMGTTNDFERFSLNDSQLTQ